MKRYQNFVRGAFADPKTGEQPDRYRYLKILNIKYYQFGLKKLITFPSLHLCQYYNHCNSKKNSFEVFT